ncbi:nucleotide sugar dehydrogenase [Clostridium perfringens]
MLYNKILNREEKISVIGLGYVGMPLAVAFAKKADVIGFDVNKEKVKEYINGKDATKEVGDFAIKNTTAKFTYNEEKLKECKFHVVAVPTPINGDKSPNLDPVIGASKILGRNLTEGSIVVYESTVYPGVTEEICIPILEKESGLKCGIDFKIGYSPERINPGDKIHTLEKIVKIVSGIDKETLETIAKIYELIIVAGVHRAESIKVAEAAKVIENSQRDINIAFMNELSIIFNKMGIDTKAVLEAAGTKWNFLGFSPGLVGGHCIGVDPFYLVYKAKEFGYESQIIASGRRINDSMGKFIAENVIKLMINSNKKIKNSKVGILGVTFKENCPDCRNTKVIDIIEELKEYGINLVIYDSIANSDEVEGEYGIHLSDIEDLNDLDAIVVAVRHDAFMESFTLERMQTMFKREKILIDVKGCFDLEEANNYGYNYWRL